MLSLSKYGTVSPFDSLRVTRLIAGGMYIKFSLSKELGKGL
jgi:hypothetical protein